MAIKKYRVTDEAENYVDLLVDTDVLTPKLAEGINDFWSDSAYRLALVNGDAVSAAARLFGALAIRFLYRDGGFNDIDPKGQYLTQQVLDWAVEGWPSLDELGIKIVDALVVVAEFETVQLEEVTA